MSQTNRAFQSPHAKLGKVPPSDVRWSSGFWAERFRLCDEVMLDSMHHALQDPTNAAVLTNFLVASGRQKGEHRGCHWSDGDVYKWIEAMAHVYEVTREPRLEKLLDQMIEVIGETQEADGYINTQIQLVPGRKRWENTMYHELYNMGHLLTAACVHHRATGKRSFLDIARKVADYLYEVFKTRPAKLVHFAWTLSVIMGLTELHRVDGNSTYLELAGIFVDMRGLIPGGPEMNQCATLLREETRAEGHGVSATYLWAGATDVFAETGDATLWEGLMRIWKNIDERKLAITGAVGPIHRGFSLKGQKEFGTSQYEVVEAFGLDYQLPNRTAYHETCANVGYAMWNWRLLTITGETRFADMMERVLFNSMLSGMSLNGRDFCYTNPLARHAGMELMSQDAPTRWNTFKCYCCPPQVARTIAQLHGWAYGQDTEGVWVHLYGGNTLDTRLSDGSPLKLRQETNYPWEGKVKITVEEAPAHTVAIRLRIPGWARNATVAVNGKQVKELVEPGRYAAVSRAWQKGDVVDLDIPLPVRLYKSHPLSEEIRNQVAVMRGPLVYCLESPDLPSGVGLTEVHLERDASFSANFLPDFLGGVTVLVGQGYQFREDWTGKLYQEVGGEERRSIELTLIPYYAWLNRGESEMAVWFPVL